VSKDNAIGRERLDGRYSVRAEKSLKAVQRALAFEHQAHNGALRGGLALRLHAPDGSPDSALRGADSQTDALPSYAR
jgi:hypothetical protein